MTQESAQNGRFEKQESLQSLRFIERKNSVIFGKITPKKMLTLLQDDGQIEKEKVLMEDEELKPSNPDSSFCEKPKKFKSLPDNEENPFHPNPTVLDEMLPARSLSKRKLSDIGVYANTGGDTGSAFSAEKKITVRRDNSTSVNKDAIYDKVKELMISVPPPATPDPTAKEEAAEELEETKPHGMCLICEQNMANSIIYPCYHSKVCYDCCLNMLGWQYSKCHYCRNDLEKIIVFDPSSSYKNIYKVLEVYGINYEDE